jgi:hypothetical protein
MQFINNYIDLFAGGFFIDSPRDGISSYNTMDPALLLNYHRREK